MARRAPAAPLALALALLAALAGAAQACWVWQNPGSTACECGRPCWCLVDLEPVAGPWAGDLPEYYQCDNCPCRTEGLFNPGDGPVLGPFGEQVAGPDPETFTAPADEEIVVPVLEAFSNDTAEALAALDSLFEGTIVEEPTLLLSAA